MLNSKVNENIKNEETTTKASYEWSQNLLNENIKKYIEQNSFYKKIILILLFIFISLIFIIIYLIQIPKKQPFIMILNEKGFIEKKIDLEKNLSTNQMLAIEQYQAIESIQNLLSVQGDVNLLKIRLEKGMNYILPNSPAEKKIKDLLNEEKNNPYILQKEARVFVYMKSIQQLKSLKNTNTTTNSNMSNQPRYYQIEMEKQIFDLKQNLKEKKQYRMMISVIHAKSKNEISIYKNPLGVFINDFEITPTIEISNINTNVY